jgi:hypothetical protein
MKTKLSAKANGTLSMVFEIELLMTIQIDRIKYTVKPDITNPGYNEFGL